VSECGFGGEFRLLCVRELSVECGLQVCLGVCELRLQVCEVLVEFGLLRESVFGGGGELGVF